MTGSEYCSLLRNSPQQAHKAIRRSKENDAKDEKHEGQQKRHAQAC